MKYAITLKMFDTVDYEISFTLLNAPRDIYDMKKMVWDIIDSLYFEYAYEMISFVEL